ncbi:chromate transporter [Serpentinicella sp. ANB-PHB4]|uniref:chromate transporter n=1 Tax=Serpentinicella sp. ANB-PHB4 TaxID=3074076 RepID=UPI0028543BD6|nr:chromate transporter [Serpentinicella sp. ANB-PHB4]MDR5658664.1 chromate transporter [Serpentinicella sp. ANB-PHB4]
MLSLKKLFLIFLKIGAFTFGGGYAMVSIMQKEFVEKEGLVTDEEFLDITAISQSLPGPIAVSTSLFIGLKLRQKKGATVALLGTILPSLTAIIVIATFYHLIRDIEQIQYFFNGIRPAIIALILLAAIKLSKPLPRTLFNIIIVILSFISIVFFNIHPIFVIIACGFFGFIFHRKGGSV